MDCSWLLEDDDGENQGSESDPEEEAQAELETRLYSIVHHSDLSQPLPPELAKHYSVQCGDDGKLTVALNNSLEIIKSEEVKNVDNLVKDSERENAVPEVIEIEDSPENDQVKSITSNPFYLEKNSYKRFRYSDVNLDLSDVNLKANEVNKASSLDANDSDFNYFKITPSFLKKKRKNLLQNLVIPSSFQIGQSSNWKDAANESFLSVGVFDSNNEKGIVEQMVCALKKENPQESSKKLYFLAQALFNHNRRKCRKNQRRKQNRAKTVSNTLEAFSNEVNNDAFDVKVSFTEHAETSDSNRRNAFDGCVSLNISPFKPLPPSESREVLVDLVSEDEIDNINETAKKNMKSLPKCEIPAKWTKKMVKFYTKPYSGMLEKDLNVIMRDLKRSSSKNDWRVDPRDETGRYHRQKPLQGKYKNRRCPNCHEHGHLMHECPKPRKVPTCFLCGLSSHTVYKCPNRICHKCGTHVRNESYECTTCYFDTFNCDIRCGVCGLFTHRSEICPDLWRSFHATVEGEKKIPQSIMENKRKYCCNCGAKGHFSHQCPFPRCEGEQLSSFVTNYSASQRDDGTTEIVVPRRFSHIMDTAETDRFLQELSNSTEATFTLTEERDYVFQVSGTFEQCSKIRSEIQGYVNTRKRKRQEPYPNKKRRKFR